MSKPKILLLEGIHPVAEQHLVEAGFDVETEKTAFNEDKVIERLNGVTALGIRSKTQITEKILKSEAAKDLSVIGAFCIGTNQIDTKCANRLGVPVFNAPYSNTRSVAELIISELIALSRKLFDVSREAHVGGWIKSAKGAFEIRGKTLGIIGYGHIGSQVSVLAEALGMRVIFYDVMKKLPLGNAKVCDSLGTLLKKADFVTLHVPETPLTQNMMGAKEIASMKKGAFLLNASRGTVVDISALSDALRSGHIAGAAVDVFPEEPENNDQKFKSGLQGLSNVILTPHIGGSTEEAQEAIGYEVSESLVRVLNYGSTTGAVNFPHLELPVLAGGVRLINVHKNVPGVLGKINSIVSELSGNIAGQHLATDAHIGYLVMDVEGVMGEELLSKVSALDVSLRTRLLR